MQTESPAIEKEFMEYVKKISHYNEAVGLIAWDLRTGAPRKGAAQRSEVLGSLSSEIFAMSTSKDMKNYLTELRQESNWEQLDEVTKKTAEECEKQLKKFENIPPEDYKDYVILTSNAEVAWETAKDTADFDSFKPYLEKIVAYNRKYTEWKGYEGNKYNALLDDYEPGLTVDVIDEVFGKLKEALVPLVKEITNAKDQPETDFLFKPFPAKKQEALSREILENMSYDFEAGRLDTTVHPFAIGLNPGDVRVTTKYDENDFRTAVFGTIHEGGHALYEQNVDKKYTGTPLCTGTSMGIHESQSLFWENFVGRHYAFWERYYDLLKKYAEGQFDNVGLEDFYRGINVAGPSLIRIEADEMTYSLHIIVRYELEKALINEELEVADLPEAWNNKMEELLGVRPEHDGEGVLQDVHWPSGAFGYFPSYALGYVYAAQLKKAMLKDLPDFDNLLKKGDLAPVKDWLTAHVHQFGKSKKPLDILKDATGEEINPDHLIDYLSTKYRQVYGLSL
ncbi:carboxypeptidase M32 [Salipaludibacillus aurantiacus]|uniref:Metal-dependent carboxypeptidase n=1 Tax=Salipaludibacillus aurantiacus TaxID=1601833 RepID=A0A1H9WGF0_9BACI|nr:carboxypeptidase M32 [Salipaludibacillus aurantiacus]SES32543.1 carboxypeptidase Taq [Salipaludibacillus aurantiacus]